MKYFTKLMIFTVVLTVITTPVGQASAAEALMPIKARIVRCVSHEERLQMCQQENLCCNLLETEIAQNDTTDETDQNFGHDIINGEKVKTHKIRHNGTVSVSIE